MPLAQLWWRCRQMACQMQLIQLWPGMQTSTQRCSSFGNTNAAMSRVSRVLHQLAGTLSCHSASFALPFCKSITCFQLRKSISFFQLHKSIICFQLCQSITCFQLRSLTESAGLFCHMYHYLFRKSITCFVCTPCWRYSLGWRQGFEVKSGAGYRGCK